MVVVVGGECLAILRPRAKAGAVSSLVTGSCPAGAGHRAPARPDRAGCWPIRRTKSAVRPPARYRRVVCRPDSIPPPSRCPGGRCAGAAGRRRAMSPRCCVDTVDAAAHAEFALLLALGEVLELVEVAGACQAFDTAGEGIVYRQIAVQAPVIFTGVSPVCSVISSTCRRWALAGSLHEA